MRVNVYAEEMTDRVEIISKEIDGQTFTGLRLYLELPVTMRSGDIVDTAGGQGPDRPIEVRGPFMHRPGDDDLGQARLARRAANHARKTRRALRRRIMSMARKIKRAALRASGYRFGKRRKRGVPQRSNVMRPPGSGAVAYAGHGGFTWAPTRRQGAA